MASIVIIIRIIFIVINTVFVTVALLSDTFLAIMIVAIINKMNGIVAIITVNVILFVLSPF